MAPSTPPSLTYEAFQVLKVLFTFPMRGSKEIMCHQRTKDVKRVKTHLQSKKTSWSNMSTASHPTFSLVNYSFNLRSADLLIPMVLWRLWTKLRFELKPGQARRGAMMHSWKDGTLSMVTVASGSLHTNCNLLAPVFYFCPNWVFGIKVMC